MEFLIGGLVVLFLLGKLNIGGLLNSGPYTQGTSPLLSGSPIGSTTDNVAAITQNLNAQTQETSTLVHGGVSVATSAATQAATAIGAASSLTKAIPIVGAAIGALTDFLLAESKKRAQEATNENQALDNAIPGFDYAIKQCVSLFNSGQITYAQVGQVLGTPRTAAYFGIPVGIAWRNLWNEVSPQIQSGRNGCSSGTVTQPEGQSFCGGKTYGASCCVAYDDIDNSMGNPNLSNGDCLFKALKKAIAKPGTPFQAVILGIYPSKYSTFSRPLYYVTVEAPTS